MGKVRTNIDRKELQEGFDKVLHWITKVKDYDVYVYPKAKDEFHRQYKRICINSSLGIEKRLYSLLHECGHLLIQDNKKNYSKEYASHVSVWSDGRKNKTDKYKISLIGEEYEAWKRGARLAKRLGIKLNKDRYEQYKAHCIMSYLHWATDPDTPADPWMEETS